jgi:hypothetical protein
MRVITNFKRAITFFLTRVMILGVLFLALSCSMDPGVEDLKGTESQKLENESSATNFHPGISLPVSFNRVDLFMSVSTFVSGTVTVQIRNADGSVVVGSTTVFASSLLKDGIKRNTFTFSPALTLNSGEKYRIYVTRSFPHSSTNSVTWRTSSGGTDPYTKGVPSVYPALSLDFAFVTYSNGYTDQQQTSTNYGFFIPSNNYRWQEFVPQYIWIVAQ